MRICGIEIQLSAVSLIILAITVLMIPLNWIIAFVISVIVHELGHLMAIAAMGLPLRGIRIGAGGIMLDTYFLSHRQELICAAAGPAAGLALIGFSRIYPQLSICAFGQSIYNLLPFYPADGGRVVRCICSMLLSDAAKPRQAVKIALICVILVVITYLAGVRITFMMMLLAVLSHWVKRKTACIGD